MSKIGSLTLERAKNLLCGLISDHSEEITKAYDNSEDMLSISLSVKFFPHRTNATQVKATIIFPLDKIKDEALSLVDEDHREIPYRNEED